MKGPGKYITKYIQDYPDMKLAEVVSLWWPHLNPSDLNTV